MIERIDHLNIVVDDMPAMIAFYRDVLGLRLTRQVTISGKWIDDVTGLRRVEAEVAFLEPPSGPSIELIRYRSPAGVRFDGPGDPNVRGFRHIAFRVQDLEGLVSTMKAAGVRFLSDVQQVPAAQVDYAQQRKSLLYCRDPEGNLLEFCAYRQA
jgi:catechol 2,3-dioxygenase-like lactoylglutathione lyase family enzyme